MEGGRTGAPAYVDAWLRAGNAKLGDTRTCFSAGGNGGSPGTHPKQAPR